LHAELEQIMQSQMRVLLSKFEECVARAAKEGKDVTNLKQLGQDQQRGKSTPGSLPRDDGYSALPLIDAEPARGSLSSRDVERQEDRIQTEQSIMEIEDPDDPTNPHRVMFNAVTLCMLLGNAVADAFEVDFLARHNTDKFPVWYKTTQLVLCIGFVVELGKRIAFKGKRFFTESRHWHYFQIVLVVFQVMEMTMILGETWFGMAKISRDQRRFFRLFSVCRIARIFHVLDHLDFTAELHLLLASMSGSMWSLLWSVLFMLIPMFAVGMALTMVVADFRLTSGVDESKLKSLLDAWGTLDRSMMSLFFSISGGISWGEVLAPLTTWKFTWASIGVMSYVASMIFAVLNVLTGVFVNSASTSATSEKERRTLDTLRKIFRDVDADGSGNLTHHEFKALLKHRDIGVCLQTLNIPPSQADHLYKLVDADGSGILEIDEFLRGVDRLQGSLTAIDFASYHAEFNLLKAQVHELLVKVNGQSPR
jgi:hypothetical protein